MNIDDLTFKQAKELLDIFGNKEAAKPHPFKIGENYLIRTVTMYAVGRLDAVYETELVLSSASWIPETGDFHDALVNGTLKHVQPFKEDVVVGRGSLVDATIWTCKLPTEKKS